MTNISEFIEEATRSLSDAANSEVVVGQTIELGSAKIIPLCRISLGFGGGGGEGDQRFCHGQGKKDNHANGKGKGSGACGGAKVRPVAAIVFTEEEVRVEKIPDKSGPLDKIFEKIPDLIDLAQKHKH
jgi:uncharacterized spore protein YtfJ